MFTCVYLVQFCWGEDVFEKYKSEWYQEQQDEGERQSRLGELDDPQQGQTRQLDDGEQVHLECPHLKQHQEAHTTINLPYV